MLLFGSSQDVEDSKRVLHEESDEPQDEDRENFITASPLDYHLFRQEITSKYPAYSPPQPLVPIEPENNSILPPLPNHHSRQTSHDDLSTLANGNTASGSIFNQPVHIATPAPSPPPSPAGPGGKGGKKQNYQTNQNFPFLYPPLDDSSNALGGRGGAELQDKVVGKRWTGGDVPASILEAGQLFASRMRMSRSLRQLWAVRERFIKEERGWGENDTGCRDECHGDEESGDDEDSLLEESSASSDGAPDRGSNQKNEGPEVQLISHIKESENANVQNRLDAVDDFYVSPLLLECHSALMQSQSEKSCLIFNP